jgi:hypothetical protein
MERGVSMGHELKKIDLQIKDGELLDVNVKMNKEKRSVIHGVIVNEDNKPFEDATVVLFKKECGDNCDLKPISYSFTDNCGQFVFGPLEPDKEIVLKVWVNGACIVDFYR